jgi:chromosome partitioning protein
MRTITVCHFKGGTGKTTFCVTMSQALATAGYRVLAVDMDVHQNHLSAALGGVEREQPSLRASKGCASGILEQIIRKNAAPNLDVVALSTEWCDRRTTDPFHLKKRFRFFNLESAYDFVVIDTPPGMGHVQEISLHAANQVCIPTDLSALSLLSLHKFMGTNPGANCKIVPIAPRETSQTRVSLAALRKQYPGSVASYSIPFDEEFPLCVLPGAAPFYALVSQKTVSACARLAADLFLVDYKRMEIELDKACSGRRMEPVRSIMFPAADGPYPPQAPCLLQAQHSVPVV